MFFSFFHFVMFFRFSIFIVFPFLFHVFYTSFFLLPLVRALKRRKNRRTVLIVNVTISFVKIRFWALGEWEGGQDKASLRVTRIFVFLFFLFFFVQIYCIASISIRV